MGEAYFYHLTQAPLEDALPKLLRLAMKAGWRVAVRGSDPARLDWLDQKLWLGREEDFLPHGVAGGEQDALQPVLLTTGAATNNAACLMTIDGAEATPEDVQAMQRVCILFDGTDRQAVDIARNQWRSLTAAGCGAKYWSEESGSWQMKSESPAKA